jgi:hypothetical protein
MFDEIDKVERSYIALASDVSRFIYSQIPGGTSPPKGHGQCFVPSTGHQFTTERAGCADGPWLARFCSLQHIRAAPKVNQDM